MTTSDPPIADLRNLGPASAARLAEIGLHTRADLVRVGAVLAYRAVKDRWPGASLNLLYALHGALSGERWDALSPDIRRRLRADAEAAFQAPPSLG